jgi:peptidoglycan hydrolase-like protein with peptidoglycan-binding domain
VTAALKSGMHGAAVSRLQSLLNASKASQRPLVADGHFGNLTLLAVTAF